MRCAMLQLFELFKSMGFKVEPAKPTLEEALTQTAEPILFLGMCVSARIFSPSGCYTLENDDYKKHRLCFYPVTVSHHHRRGRTGQATA